MNQAGDAIISGSNKLDNGDCRLYLGQVGVEATEPEGSVLTSNDMTLNAGPASQGKQPVFVYEAGNEEFKNMTHISLDYKSRTATSVRLVLDRNGEEVVREVILAHRYSPTGIDAKSNTNYESGKMRNSGKIPLTSFDFTQYFEGVRNYSSIDPAKIKRIEIAPLAPANNPPVHGSDPTYDARTADFALKFKIENITIHTGTPFVWTEPDQNPIDQTGVAKMKLGGRNLAVTGITSNALKLNIAQTGKYDVKVFSANGRMVQSFNAASLTAGVNTLKLNNLAKGVYMIQIQGIDTKQKLTKSALVM
jgi:hypothetical protein